MVDRGNNPREERAHLEECILLPYLVQLRVSVQQTCRDELVEDAHDEGWQDREDDVVERERPGFVDNFSREGILEHVLEQLA